VTIPVEPIVAVPVIDDDHVPPDVALVRVILAPTHTLVAPDIVPAVGSGFTVITLLEEAEPHAVVMLYVMVSAPEVIP
jgi:hypothetical protein